MKRSLAVVTAAIAVSLTCLASAQSSLSTQLSATTVQVGQRFSIQVTCNYGDETPSDPRLPVPQGFEGQGPSISNQQSISIVNGHMERKTGLVATWILAATAVGRYRIGPASIVIGGKRLVDRAVEVEVVAATSRPQAGAQTGRGRRLGIPFDPFDPFGGSDPFSGPMFPPMPGMRILPSPGDDGIPTYPPELDVAKARDQLAFLDARATPKRVVIGEQIRLNVYAYNKPGMSEAVNLTEPSLDGFLSFRSDHDDMLTRAFAIRIGDERWMARKFLSYALFPTKTGTLTIGPTVMTFATQSRLLSGNADTADRKSAPIAIVVEEPPLSGRPSFYHLGDVGQFKLTASVEPRKINVGEAVSVQVDVSGTGQLPQRVDPPEQTGLDWLEPSVSQQVGEQQDKVGGARQFAFVVRMNRAGLIDLGEFRFAYFDPGSRKYEVARAKLGIVEVTAVTAAGPQPSGSTGAPMQAPTSPGSPDNANPLQPRMKLTEVPVAPRHLADSANFFQLLLAGPLSVGLYFGLKAAGGKVQKRRRFAASSAKSQINAEFAAATKALGASDYGTMTSSIERTVHLAIEDRARLRSRGILRSELLGRLTAAQMDASIAASLVEILERCDEQRFLSIGANTNAKAETDTAVALLSDAKKWVLATLDGPRKKTGFSS